MVADPSAFDAKEFSTIGVADPSDDEVQDIIKKQYKSKHDNTFNLSLCIVLAPIRLNYRSKFPSF